MYFQVAVDPNVPKMGTQWNKQSKAKFEKRKLFMVLLW